MVSLVEQFGGKRPRTDPIMPPVPRPMPVAPHEKTAQALAFVTKLNDEVEGLREENARLRADLNLSLMRCRDLEQAMASMRSDMEAYRRYAVEVKTHLQHIVDAATRANEAAIEAGEQRADERVDQQAERVIGETERELRDMATQEIGKKFGADARAETIIEPQHG